MTQFLNSGSWSSHVYHNLFCWMGKLPLGGKSESQSAWGDTGWKDCSALVLLAAQTWLYVHCIILDQKFHFKQTIKPSKTTSLQSFKSLSCSAMLGQTQGSKPAPLKQCSPHLKTWHLEFAVMLLRGLYLTPSLLQLLKNSAFCKNPKAAPQPTQIVLGMLLLSRQPLIPAHPGDVVP